MVFRILITLIFIISLYPLSSATIINIPADWPTIQQGIDASSDGDTVLVQPGTYYENINFNGHNIVLGSLFLTTGDTSYIEQTLIDGSQSSTYDGHIHFGSGESNSARITGFTIQNANIPSAGNICCDSSSPTINYNIIKDANILAPGGGISCKYFSSPIISNNVIINNFINGIDLGGGGIYCRRFCEPVIRDNIISGNTSAYGGGIFCFSYSNVEIINNIIVDNSAWFGGGILTVYSTAVIRHNDIVNNEALYYGGGLYCGGSFLVTISNNRIAGNIASHMEGHGKGGGIYCQAAASLIINNSFYGNRANSAGGALYCDDSNPLVINSIFRADSIGWPLPVETNEIFLDNSSAVVEYSNIQGGWPGTGNIDVDPLFRDPDNGDFHLMSIACGDSADSPCIDAGDPNILDSLLDCSWGLGGSRSDMGAYGGGDSLVTAIFNDMPNLPGQFLLLQNYPNPFNARTTIRFILPEPQDVELTIYDLLGRQVGTLIDEYKQAGVHAVTFDASGLSSGVYFYRLQAGDRIETKRMVLLK